MTPDLTLGIDLGTSAVKVAAVDANGEVAAGSRVLLTTDTPNGWWGAVVRATRSVLAATPDTNGRVAAIGLSGRGGATVLCDRTGVALGPPGLRPPAEAQALGLDDVPPRLRPLAVHLLALAREDPAALKRLRHVFAAKDYLAFRVTGAAVTDPASGPDAAAWPAAALAAVGFPIGALPAVRLPWQTAGGLLPDAAASLGLPRDLPVAVGAHDGVAAQIGTGMLGPGQAALTLGTHAVLRIILRGERPRAGRFRFYTLWGDRDGPTVYGGNAREGGASLAWLAGITGQRGELAFAGLESAACRVTLGSDGLLFLPFLAGMRHPELHRDAKGAFLGLCSGHAQGHLFRAVLEGVAFALRHIAEALADTGVVPRQVCLTGAGARSALWRQILADVLRLPLAFSAAPGFEECAGAARCAWVALGRFADLEDAVASATRSALVVSPDPANAQAMDAEYARYRAAVGQWLADAPPSTAETV